MKKNRMMRLASVLLVAVLMTTCTISGTFAKYVTEGSAEDYARVAKWGVEVTPNGVMFAKEYAKNDDSYVKDNTVASSNEWKVVAPGTTGNMTEVQITGTPEVATRITYDATIVLTNWKLEDGTEYCPIIFTVEGIKYYIGNGSIHNVDELITAVKTAIGNCKRDYEPKTNLAEKNKDFPTVSWEWEFEGDKADATLRGYQTDAKDTELGNLAVSRDTFVKVDITTTVTQID